MLGLILRTPARPFAKLMLLLGIMAAATSNAAGPAMPQAGDDLMRVYRGLHAHPELSFKEVQTSRYLAHELQELGFSVSTGLGDAWVRDKAHSAVGELRPGVGGYGVVGVLRNGPGPTVLIRTDMDGLPVPENTGVSYASTVEGQTWTGVDSPVMHACGHDVHMTSWVGTARELVAKRRDWSGTLVLIAQPAEEIGLGAQAMLEDGLYARFPRPDYNLALHVSAATPAGTVSYSSGWALANVDSVDITVRGVGGHGAYPHTTVDPVLIAAHIVTSLQSLVARNVDPQTPAVVTVGSITAGAKHNIIPEQAQLLLTVRSYADDTRKLLLDGIRRIAKGQAAAFGAPAPTVAVETDYTPATYNDPDLTRRAMAAIGREIGKDQVQTITAVMGGEDFSQYGRTSDKIPSLIFWVGAVEPQRYAQAQKGGQSLPSLHSPSFAPDAAKTIDTGVRAMTAAALALLKED
nr:amidohydrolase [Oceanococcus sp. HetDA_MAG_MS8]